MDLAKNPVKTPGLTDADNEGKAKYVFSHSKRTEKGILGGAKSTSSKQPNAPSVASGNNGSKGIVIKGITVQDSQFFFLVSRDSRQFTFPHRDKPMQCEVSVVKRMVQRQGGKVTDVFGKENNFLVVDMSHGKVQSLRKAYQEKEVLRKQNGTVLEEVKENAKVEVQKENTARADAPAYGTLKQRRQKLLGAADVNSNNVGKNNSNGTGTSNLMSMSQQHTPSQNPTQSQGQGYNAFEGKRKGDTKEERIEKAFRAGVKVITLKELVSYMLDLYIKEANADPATYNKGEKTRQKWGHSGYNSLASTFTETRTRKLRGSFLKFEDLSGKYKPTIIEFYNAQEGFPVLNPEENYDSHHWPFVYGTTAKKPLHVKTKGERERKKDTCAPGSTKAGPSSKKRKSMDNSHMAGEKMDKRKVKENGVYHTKIEALKTSARVKSKSSYITPQRRVRCGSQNETTGSLIPIVAPVTTAEKRKLLPATAPKREGAVGVEDCREKAKSGYCECCSTRYEDYDVHIDKREHKKRIKSLMEDSNVEELFKNLASSPHWEEFLKDCRAKEKIDTSMEGEGCSKISVNGGVDGGVEGDQIDEHKGDRKQLFACDDVEVELATRVEENSNDAQEQRIEEANKHPKDTAVSTEYPQCGDGNHRHGLVEAEVEDKGARQLINDNTTLQGEEPSLAHDANVVEERQRKTEGGNHGCETDKRDVLDVAIATDRWGSLDDKHGSAVENAHDTDVTDALAALNTPPPLKESKMESGLMSVISPANGVMCEKISQASPTINVMLLSKLDENSVTGDSENIKSELKSEATDRKRRRTQDVGLEKFQCSKSRKTVKKDSRPSEARLTRRGTSNATAAVDSAASSLRITRQTIKLKGMHSEKEIVSETNPIAASVDNGLGIKTEGEKRKRSLRPRKEKSSKGAKKRWKSIN
eukprot:Nk52_evm17s2622 gene=Nk52_evmTU17s2622